MEYGDSHGPSPWGLEVWFGWGSSAWPACGGAGSSGCYSYSCCCCCLGAQELKALLSGPLWMSPGFSEPPQRPLDPGIEPRSPALQTDSLLTELQGKPNNVK